MSKLFSSKCYSPLTFFFASVYFYLFILCIWARILALQRTCGIQTTITAVSLLPLFGLGNHKLVIKSGTQCLQLLSHHTSPTYENPLALDRNSTSLYSSDSIYPSSIFSLCGSSTSYKIEIDNIT